MVIQTRDNGDLGHTVIRGSDKNLSDYKNILKKGSTDFLTNWLCRIKERE